MSRRQTNASNDRKSVDDMLTYSSHSHSDLVNTWEQHNMKDQHDKIGGVNRFVTDQRNDRDSSLGTIDWKPLKWTRPGCSSSRDSGFSRSSGMRSLGGTNSMGSCEWKVGLQQKFATAVESNSGEAATCRALSAPSEEENSRKKPRLKWGEGLAKFERKQVDGPEVTSNNDDPVSPPFNMEPNNFLSTGLVDRSPKVSGLSGCASPATPSSAARSSSPGILDFLLLFIPSANVVPDQSNLPGRSV
jgi:nuclear receptor co-repressor 1